MFKGKFFQSMFTKETPTGTINGVNTDFTLSVVPASSQTVLVFIDGLMQTITTDYTLSNQTISFVNAPALGQEINVFYLEK